MGTTNGLKTERQQYEQTVAHQIEKWRAEIDRLRAHAEEGKGVSDSVGDQATQVEKLDGQVGILHEHFDQMRAVDTADAWSELREGIDKKVDRLEEAFERTRHQLGLAG